MKNNLAKLLLLFLVIGSLLGAFYGGRYVGQSDERRAASMAVRNMLARNGVDNLIILRSAIEKLRAGKVGEADSVLVAYAKLQIPSVAKCGESPICRASAGPSVPSAEELEAINALSPMGQTVRH